MATVATRPINVWPKFDARSRAVYSLLALLIPASWLSLYLTGLSLGPRWSWFVPIIAGFAIFIAVMVRRLGHWRFSSWLETSALMVAQGTAIAVMQFPMIALDFPFVDRWLLAADTALGFDWHSFAARWQPYEGLLRFAYDSMTWQSALVLAILCWFGHEDRAWRLVTASLIALVITISIFPFAVAQGSFVGCGAHCEWIPIIQGVKSGSITVIERQLGMVSFPSFHTAAAILLAWAFWPLKWWLRYPAIALNLLMIAGTIVVGSHYLIDIIGGATVAAASLRCCGWASLAMAGARASTKGA